MTFNRTTLIAGVFAGLGTALWTLFEFAMGWHGERMDVGAKTGFVGILFPVAGILWALRETKAEHGGQLSLRQALLVGVSVALLLSAIGLVFYQLYYTVINPGFLARVQPAGAPTNTASTNTVAPLVTVVAGSLGLSLVVALIGGLVMRTPVNAPRA